MARLLITLALGASALTQDEAQCIAKFNGGQTIVRVGDSNTRYESLAFNEFLEQGTILSSLARNGDEGKGQIDDLTFWNRPPGYSPPRSGDGSHLRRMDKKYKTGGSSSYFFAQTTW